jgi:hypothetical protein
VKVRRVVAAPNTSVTASVEFATSVIDRSLIVSSV